MNVNQDEMVKLIEECENSEESLIEKILSKLGLENLVDVRAKLLKKF